MDKILKANGFRHIESEYQKGFFVKTYRKFIKGNKYIVKIFPGKGFFRILFMDKLVLSGPENQLESSIKSLSLKKRKDNINYLNK